MGKVQCPQCNCVFYDTPPSFRPPTFEQVKAYCDKRKNGVSPQGFIDFYESKGWMIGKNKMKSFEAAIRTWEANDKNPLAEGEKLCLLCNTGKVAGNAKICLSCGVYCRVCHEQTARLRVVRRKDKSLSAWCERCYGARMGK